LSLLIPVAASAAQCIEQVEILNIPEEIERYGGVDDFESNVLQWRSESVVALEDMDNGNNQRAMSCNTSDRKTCGEEEAIDDVAEDYDTAYAKRYHRNAIEFYDQILDALECYADAS